MVELNGASGGTVTFTWAIPELSVNAVAGLMKDGSNIGPDGVNKIYDTNSPSDESGKAKASLLRPAYHSPTPESLAAGS